MTIGLRLHVSRHEPDVDGAFLANRANSTLGTATARTETDLHVFGASASEDVLAATAPAEVTLALDLLEVERDADGVLLLPARARVGCSVSRVALGIDGTVCAALSGQSSVSLKELMINGSAVADCAYGNWAAIGSVVHLAKPKLVDLETDGVIDTVKFVKNVELDARQTAAASLLEKIYVTGLETRKVVVFEPAAMLTKSVAKVPYGIDGSGYDLACNVVDRPVTFSDSQFESLATACLKIAGTDVDTLLAECKTPNLTGARKHAPGVAKAMSTLVSIVCPYRVDARTALMPNGLVNQSVEFWKAEAPRSATTSSDDCEGSGAIITSALKRAKDIARDDKLAAEFPVTAAIANAMAHHFVGVAVLAANAGHADSAGEDVSNVAGHALALALPRSHVYKAYLTFLRSSSGKADESAAVAMHVQNTIDVMSKSLFDERDVARMPAAEAALVRSHAALEMLKGLVPLAMEGTSPVTSCVLYEPDDGRRNADIEAANMQTQAAQQIGASVARSIASLHVGGGSGDGHRFYNSMVEFSLDLDETFFAPALQATGCATGQLVFASKDSVQIAGATPKDLAVGEYAMLPLWRVGTEEAALLLEARKEVRANTMPTRRMVPRLDEHSSEVFDKNVKCMKKFEGSTGDHIPKLQQILTYSAMIHNANAMELYCAKLAEKGNVSTTILPTPGFVFDSEGTDVGCVVLVNHY